MAPSLERTTHKTICCYCGVGCGILIHKHRDGTMKLEGDPDYPVNQGKLCSKGINLLHTALDQSDRLQVPQLRHSRDHNLADVTWEEAITKAAKVFQSLIARYGPDSVGFYVSGQCLTEEYYLANKITKGFLGTNNIDTNSRLCMSSAVAGYKLALGEDTVPGCYADLDQADLYLVAGANPAFCHPILFRRIEARILGDNPRAKMIVVDPRKTQTAGMGTLHLNIVPGSDVVLFNAWARILMDEGKIDRSFIKKHTEGWEEIKTAVNLRSVSEAAQICGISEEDLREGARLIGESRHFMSLWAMGLNQSTIGVNKNLALINLHLLTGQIGGPGQGPFSLTGQPNAMGGREVGGMANLLSAHRDMSNPAHRKEIAEYWGVPSVPEKPGLTAGEMMDALLDGRLKALWIVCTNPLVSWPDLGKAEKALKAARFVVVQDISNRCETLDYADLILPAAGWLEKEGTMTNSERRVAHLSKVLDPPGQSLSDSEIFLLFAKKMGWGDKFNYPSLTDVYQEHAMLTQGTNLDVSGLSYWRLKTEGSLQWPVPGHSHGGTPRLFLDKKFYRPGGRARLHGLADQNQSPSPTPEHPLILTTGRLRDQWHTMTKTGKVNRLKAQEPESFLEIHPQDAQNREIEDGTMVNIFNPTGQVRLRARITDTIRPGVVFLPIHWGKLLGHDDLRANNLTQTRWDPISKEPDLKYALVQVSPYKTSRKTVLIVGAGAASAAFLKAYRTENLQDEITIFSGEKNPFYDRIRLPEYMNGQAPWVNLITLNPSELEALGVCVKDGISIKKIDRTSKKIQDQLGNWHEYDILILATGSRPFLPREAPKIPGIHTLRTKEDAHNLLASVGQDRQLVVVGGGLLGLEVAVTFRSLGRSVHLVQRSSRLMDKQLDDIAGDLLVEELMDRGIQFHFQDEIAFWKGSDKLEEVVLSSGQRIQNAALVYAVGTIPNGEIGRECGLAMGKGIQVDGHLQTSDPWIYALGEVAEWEGQLFGITSAAEEQAKVAARYLCGDVQATYKGSLSQNLLKVPGLSLVSLGQVKVEENDSSHEIITLLDAKARYYKKLVIKNDRLLGALLMGDKEDLLDLREIIQSGLELGARRQKLLRPGVSASRPKEGRMICTCFTTDEGFLLEAYRGGARSLEELQSKTGAGTGCGSCRPELKSWLDQRQTQVGEI